ncbi:MAG TPA: hypothetical protein VEL75_05700 [Candidatus Methylomirabilis sp.]|nr:hypothetical protein [Candidatus Methylomirabilis sp.]
MTGAGVLLGAAFLSACSSSEPAVKRSSKSLCESAGGRYVEGVCQPGSATAGKEICQQVGGFYIVEEDVCHISK